MTDRPILFSAPMVRAILVGTKTQTRRSMNPQPVRSVPHTKPLPGGDDSWVIHHPLGWRWRNVFVADEAGGLADLILDKCPYGVAGDRLWVRETWALIGGVEDTPLRTVYRADGDDYSDCESEDGDPFRWRPSIHMPRARSRITLEITEVRIERLHAITEQDAYAEGMKPSDAAIVIGADGHIAPEMSGSARGAFACLWGSINGKRAPWVSNPWVWAISFQRVTP